MTGDANAFFGNPNVTQGPMDPTMVESAMKSFGMNMQSFSKMQKNVKKDLDEAEKDRLETERIEKRIKEGRESRQFAELEDLKHKKKNAEDQKKMEEELEKLRGENDKQEKENTEERLKNSKLSDLIPESVQKIEPQDEKQQEEKPEKKEEGMFSKFSNSLKILPQAVKDAASKKDDKKEVGSEQKNLGEEVTRVSFNPEGIKIIQKLLTPIYNALGVGHPFFEDIIKNQKEQSGLLKGIGLGGGGGLMDLLKIGGMAAGIVALFWPQIRDWLEEKLGVNLQIFERIRGIFDGIGKFFLLEKGVNPVLKLIGKTFTGIGELIEGVLKAAIEVFFPVAEKGVAGSAAKGGAAMFKGLLPKMAGGIFKVLGATALKGIPVLGGLFSFYLGYNRFKDGDALGGLIDIIGGIGNILELTPLAPIGFALNWGALALNAILDLTGVTGRGSNQRIGKFAGNMFDSIGKALMKVPFIKGVVDLSTGIWDFYAGIFGGDTKQMVAGLDKMKDVPLIGTIASVWKGLLSLGETKNTETGTKTFSVSKMFSELRKRIGKTILGWVPDIGFGVKKMVADAMGVEYNETSNEPVNLPPPPVAKSFDQGRYDKLNKQRKEFLDKANTKGASKEDKEMYENLATRAGTNMESMLKARTPEQIKNAQSGNQNDTKNKSEVKPETSSTSQVKPEPTIVNQPENKPADYAPASQPIKQQIDEKWDKAIKMQNENNLMLIQTLSKFAESIKNTTPGATIINNNKSSPPDKSKDYLFKPIFDVNTEKRIQWWKASREYSATV
jgi:hypothetical protein